ncbi:polymorphic toxin-type HINT domain-containing protein [Streptomyces heliomycini]|uniref:Polymorphic toxin-type HINT domain-containing protein n=1 Tax=Streptomyces heliomycini TaxID=284032 RepID=A0ABV5L8C9_9ACTN|nr:MULTISPECIES: polymorphic toxin-type HINT domain-containing protein [Streptomyces]
MTVHIPAPHERGRPWSGGSLRHIAGSLSLVLALGLVSGVSTAAAAPETPRTAADKPTVTQAVDIPSARVAARLSGKRVEALSERTETSTTWANEDGSLTTELTAGPIRFEDGDTGEWRKVDLDLRQDTDGSVAPEAHPRGLRLAGRSGKPAASLKAAREAEAVDLVTLGEGDRQITLQWKGGLPEPELDGTRAVYPEAVPDADVVVEATRTGFEQFVEIKKRPTTDGYTYTLPLKAKGLKAKQLADGSVRFTDKKGKKQAVMPAPVMWDSTVDERSGEHTRQAEVGMKVVQKGSSVDLVITPDAKFLADPKTKYPVTVDPSTSSLGNVFDTYVQQGTTVDWSTDVELDFGNPGTTNADGTPRTAQSFISWNTAPVQDALVLDAKLSLWNFHSGNNLDCKAYPWEVWSSGAASTSSRWANRPAMTAKKATSTETRGNTSCTAQPDGWINADVTTLVQEWASAKATRGHMGVRASDENVVAQWKRVNSANAATNPPKLVVNYNYRPRTGTKQEAGPPYFSYGGEYVVNTTTPTLRDTFVDADGDKVNGTFQIFDNATNTQVGDVIVSKYVPSGQVAPVTVPAGVLANGRTYKFRTSPYDGSHYNNGWSAWKTFRVDTTAPSAPTSITSTDYPSTAWVKNAGQAGTFTVIPNGTDHNWLEWSLDGVTWTKVATGGSTAAKAIGITPPKNGTHTLQVRQVDKADNKSEAVDYTFHAGPGGFVRPDEGERTARRLPLVAEADGAKYDKVSFSWRRSEADPWVRIPAGHVTSAGTPLTAWPVALTAGRNDQLVWDATTTVDPDGTVQIKADFTGPGNASGSTEPLSVVVDRTASGAATDEIGPGSLNLLTGDYTLSATDTTHFDLSVTRTASSRKPEAGAQQAGQVAIFGKEWVSGTAAEATDSDYSHLQRISDTAVAVVDLEGEEISFTANAAKTGWIPEPGSEELTLTGSVTGSFTLSDTEGTVTQFTKPGPAATSWQVSSALMDGLAQTTTTVVSETVTVDGKTLARPKRVIAPTSAASAATCTATPATKGCRALEFVYATTTTANATTPGDFTGQVKELRLWSTEPGAASATAKTVQTYRYDAAGRLTETWNPLISPALKTQYGYDTAGRVTRVTPPGQLPWTFTYGKAGSSSAAGDGMLLKASRPALRQGTLDVVEGDAATGVVYDVPLTGTAAPYKMGATDVKAWGQTDAPTDATAVFPADAVPASNAGGSLTATSYKRADVTYMGASGRAVNSVVPGGHITTTEYDRFGNTVRELTAANRAVALGTTAADRTAQAELGITSLAPSERAGLLATKSVYNDNGTRELEEFGPLRRVDLTADLKSGTTTLVGAGSPVTARSWTVNEYDAGRPTDGTATVKDQVTRVTTGAQVREHPGVHGETRVVQTVYDWAKGLPVKSIQDPAGLAITTTTEYDALGRVVKTYNTGSTGADAGTVVTTYWSATGTGACAGRPEWADLVCSTGPGGAITGGGGNPTQLPTTETQYDWWGNATVGTDTANGVTRTTTTSYDAAGRPETVKVTGGVGQAVPETTTEYDPATGEEIRTTSPTGGAITRVYDKLGRIASYTDADGGRTTTEYDLLDRPVKVGDTVPSTVTFSYDHTVEPRGLATKTTDSVAGVFQATYDADGSVATEKLPGGYTLTQTEDTTGAPVDRTYTRDSDGTVVMSDAVTESVQGQTTGHAGWSDQTYRYDAVGRLVQVDDTVETVCTRRTYGFDKHANRTSLTTAASAPGADCPTTGGTSRTSTFDSADRITDAGYGYDAFGRTSSLPGGVSVGYYTNDLAYQQTSGTKRQTWSLDAALRFRAWTVETSNGGTWSPTENKLNHYDGDNDNPRWIVENTATGTLTRNVDSLSGNLGAVTSATGDTVLQFTDIHGDVALQLPLNAGEAPIVLDTDEYGNPRDKQQAVRYGWLGGKQRSSETVAGYTLMGVRQYNPATGRFLSVDPQRGGNANAYEYCSADPVNCFDLDGKWGWKKIFKKAKRWAWRNKWDIALTAAGFVPGLGAAAWGYRAYRGYRALRAARTIARSCRRNSFLPQTPVVMADGNTKPISQVEVGDLVRAVDETTGETTVSPVSDVITGHGTKDLVTLSVDADGDGRSKKITATANHPFFVQGRGWVDAVRLTPGSRLSNPSGIAPEVTATNRTQAVRTVFNLTVAGSHTYFVVTDGRSALVHNCARYIPKKRNVLNWWHPTRFSSKAAAVRHAKQVARTGGRCRYRGPCGSGNHVHVDFINRFGRIFRTNHYRW